MDLPRLLFVNEAFYPHKGGAERRSYEIVKRLIKRGFQVKIITNSFGNPLEESVSDFDIDYVTRMEEHDYFHNGSRTISGVMKFASSVKRRLMEYRDYDILTFDEFPLLHAIRAGNFIPQEKIRFFTWHEVLRKFYLLNGGIWRIAAGWEKKVSSQFRRNIAVSRSVSNLLRETYGLDDVTVIENGVDSSQYWKTDDKDWGKVLYVGRVEAHKRLDTLIRCFKNRSRLSLEIVGSGSQLPYIQKVARDVPNVSVLGHVESDELIEKMRQAWFFVMPSLREGFSISSLEAMAASTPVATTNTQFNLAANELVRDGKTGIVSDSIENMVGKVDSIYDQHDTWKALSSGAFDLSRNYDWTLIMEKLSNLYSQAWY